MRLCCLLMIAAVLATPCVEPLPAQSPTPPGAELVKTREGLQPAPADWKGDPVCQMVFFAVLEGLYTYGVADDVVAAVLRGENGKISEVFIDKCPLCYPVYEAFVLYQKRQTFVGAAKQNTFGKGVAPELANRLKSKDIIRTQIPALTELLRPWVERKLTTTSLTEEQKKELSTRLLKRRDEGNNLVLGYKRCAICDSTSAACEVFQSGKKKD